MSVLKSVVITGCSSGFGRVTALHLARHGWRVFATVRRETDRDDLLAEAQALGCRERLAVLLCDITRVEQVRALAEAVSAATPRLDALVNNAGAAFPAPLELLPLDALRIELAPFGVGVVVLEPGPSPTAIWAASRQRALAGMTEIDTSAYAPLIAALEQAADRRSRTGFPPQAFAEEVLKILNSRHPRARYAIPWQTAGLMALRRLLPDASWDWLVRRALKW